MKTLIKYSMIILSAFLFCCSTDEKTIDDVLDDVGRGAILRTSQIISPAMDVLDPSSIWSVEVEEQDGEDGDLLKELRLYASLIDNTIENGTTETEEALVHTFQPSDFQNDEFGLPKIVISSTLSEMTSAIGISSGDYSCGDQMELRLELELTTGQIFTKGDTNPNISGGQFFSSPYFYRASLIAPLSSEELFTGQYQLTTTQEGGLGGNDYADGTYTIEALSNTVRVIRNVPTLPDFGPFGPVDITFELVCGQIVFTPGQSIGAGCNATVLSGTGDTNDTYEIDSPDDSSFVLFFVSDETSDCGAPTQAAIRLDKN